MIYNLLDFFILKSILEKKKTTTWNMAKSFGWSDKKDFEEKKEQTHFLDNKDCIIRSRLKNMSKEGLIIIQKNSKKNVYIVDKKKVCIKSQKFPDEKKGKVLWIKESDGKWQSYQI